MRQCSTIPCDVQAALKIPLVDWVEASSTASRGRVRCYWFLVDAIARADNPNDSFSTGVRMQ